MSKANGNRNRLGAAVAEKTAVAGKKKAMKKAMVSAKVSNRMFTKILSFLLAELRLFSLGVNRLLSALAILFVRFYQIFISPALPQSCIHHPTCSAYAILAFRKHGFFKGALFSLRRISSCRPNADVKHNDYP